MGGFLSIPVRSCVGSHAHGPRHPCHLHAAPDNPRHGTAALYSDAPAVSGKYFSAPTRVIYRSYFKDDESRDEENSGLVQRMCYPGDGWRRRRRRRWCGGSDGGVPRPQGRPYRSTLSVRSRPGSPLHMAGRPPRWNSWLCKYNENQQLAGGYQ